MVRRVHVIGAGGAGKSTFARRVAGAIGVEPVDLDTVACVQDGAELLATCERLAAGPAWVCEGIYCGWTEPLLRAADRIVWLDLPPAVSAYRIVRRHVRSSLAGDNPHKGLRLLVRFTYDMSWRYARRPVASDAELAGNPGANSRATVVDRLHPYAGKVVRVRSRADVRRLTDLAASGGRW